jgi:DNA-binding transcriptional ArsR family regulator
MTDDDRVFKALADPTRRFLLDLLHARDGRTLTELEAELAMTRFGAMKHLRVLEDAGLVVTRRSGREKLHYLNPVPIQLIHDRWIDKYTRHQMEALTELKARLEAGTVPPPSTEPGSGAEPDAEPKTKAKNVKTELEPGP